MPVLRSIAILCSCLLCARNAAADDKSNPGAGPAIVENRVKESDLTTIKLTADAERRLGIELVAVERKSISLPRRLPGEVLIPPGRTIVVSAPIAGLVGLPPLSESPPAVGQRVERGGALLRLQPGESRDGQTFVPADRISLGLARADLTAARIEAEGLLVQARVRVVAAEVKRKRADELRKEGAGAQRAYDEAQAELDLSTAQRTASQERVEILERVLTSLESGEQAAITIEAPLSGYVRTVHTAPGHVVSSGAPLLEIVGLDPVWIRVPVYVGELAAIDEDGSARVRGLTDGPQSPSCEAKRVLVPGSADPQAATVDLFFELANPTAELRPGQRLLVELAAATTGESLVVPHAAILFDIYGGTWVYEVIAPLTYARKRVTVRDVVGGMAAIGHGLEPGAKVVTSGAAELFGTEFGAGK